jgi:hypothetical protein
MTQGATAAAAAKAAKVITGGDKRFIVSIRTDRSAAT